MEGMKRGSASPPNTDDSHKLYFASIDIERCYDTIDTGRLMEVVTGLLSEEEYLVSRFNVTYPYTSLDLARSKVPKYI
jgi:hypothetical protein